MNPIEAVSAGFKKYATFSGRSPRSEFWWFYLTYMLVIFVGGPIFEPIYLAFFVMVIPLWAVGIRRMHDTGHSGWWFAVPIINVVFCCIEGTSGPNKYGDVSITEL